MPEPTVLVTRTQPGANATAARLEAAGVRAVVTPMLRIAPRPMPETLADVQAVLLTSAHAARRLADAPEPIPRVLAVGAATAAAAREAGATDVRSADGDAAALAALARDTLDPAAGPLLHLRGGQVAADTAGALIAAGFAVREHVVYAGEPAPALAPEAEQALRDGAVDAALFHSAAGCRAFLDAVDRAGLGDRLSGVVAASLSPAAGAPAGDRGFAAHVSAAQPLEKSLIDALIEALNARC